MPSPLHATGCLLASAALILTLGLPACANEHAAPDTATAFKAVERAIGDAPCQTSADCRVIGVGAKSCGGPERYLPWSVRYTQAAELEQLVEQHRTLRRSEDRRDGRVSNCAVTPEPGTQCVAGRCEARPGQPSLSAR